MFENGIKILKLLECLPVSHQIVNVFASQFNKFLSCLLNHVSLFKLNHFCYRVLVEIVLSRYMNILYLPIFKEILPKERVKERGREGRREYYVDSIKSKQIEMISIETRTSNYLELESEPYRSMDSNYTQKNHRPVRAHIKYKYWQKDLVSSFRVTSESDMSFKTKTGNVATRPGIDSTEVYKPFISIYIKHPQIYFNAKFFVNFNTMYFESSLIH